MLKILSINSTSKQPFNYTIKDSIRDAVVSNIYLHKVEDFLSQAARYLRK
jgi:hypothetical protein